jgi:hypothetical protein
LIVSIWVGAAQLFGCIYRPEMMAIDGLHASFRQAVKPVILVISTKYESIMEAE